MEIAAIAEVVIAVTFIVLVAFLIPVLIEVRKTAVSLRAYITDIESQLQPALRELRELMANLRLFAEGVASRTDEVKSFMTALGDTGRTVSRINVAIGDVASVLSRSSLWLTGLKAASHYIINRIAKKRR